MFAALTLWAFLGLESATVPAGNVRNPDSTIPRATIVGTAFAAALYILVTIVAFGVVSAEQLAESSAPLAAAATKMWGGLGGTFVAIGACISTFGALNGFTMLSGQVPAAAARDGAFPRRFGVLSARETPTPPRPAPGSIIAGMMVVPHARSPLPPPLEAIEPVSAGLQLLQVTPRHQHIFVQLMHAGRTISRAPDRPRR